MENISQHKSDSPETHCLNYIPITNFLATSGQPTPIQIEAIAAVGYRHIINLAMHDSTDALYEEGGLVSEAGMNYFHIPVPFDSPTLQQLQLFFALMNTLSKDKVWVHCAYNWRASAFVYHYQRSVLKQAVDIESLLVLKQWEPDKAWQDFLSLKP